MKLSTKRGDKGKTGTLSGDRVLKSDPYIQFLGDVDELQAFIGVSELHKLIKEKIQYELYEIMAGNTVDFDFDTEVEHDGKFILPTGFINVARTVCRRAERSAVAADCMYAVPYLNRLSDLLYKEQILFNG